MKPEHHLRAGLVIALLATGLAINAEDFKPGVQHICIPNAARDGWDCGTIDNPPKPGVVEEQEVVEEETAPLPPPFLMNPEGPVRSGDAIAEQPATPEPEPIPEPEAPLAESEPEPSETVPPTEAIAEESATLEPEPLPEPETPVAESEPVPVESEPTAMQAPASAPVTEPVAPAVAKSLESEPLPEPVAAETESLPEPEAPEPVAAESEPVVIEAPRSTPVAEPIAQPVVETPVQPEPVEPEPAQPSAVDIADAPVSVESMPEPEPQSVSESAPVSETESAPAAIAEPGPAAVAQPPEQAAAAPVTPLAAVPGGRLLLSSLQGARAFAQLPSSHYTLQLAYAASAERFPALIQQLGIDHTQCYVLRVRRDNGDWFVLAYGSYVDVSVAKAALMQIRPAPGMTAVWPRRVGYLQGEYRP